MAGDAIRVARLSQPEFWFYSLLTAELVFHVRKHNQTICLTSAVTISPLFVLFFALRAFYPVNLITKMSRVNKSKFRPPSIHTMRSLCAILHPGVCNWLVRAQFQLTIHAQMLQYVRRTLLNRINQKEQSYETIIQRGSGLRDPT